MFSNLLPKRWGITETKRELDLEMEKPNLEAPKFTTNYPQTNVNTPSCNAILTGGEMYLINGSQVDILMKNVECTPQNKVFKFNGFSAKKDKYSSIIVDCSSMRHLRWHAADMLQFVIKINDLIYLEYGIYCSNDTLISGLYKALAENLCTVFTRQYSSMIKLYLYDDSSSSYSQFEQPVEFSIYEAAQDKTYFIVANSQLSNESCENYIYFLAFISALDAMRPLMEESTVDFWVPQNNIDQIALFRCKFEDTKCVETVVKLLESYEYTTELLEVDSDSQSAQDHPQEVADKDFVLLNKSDSEETELENSKTFKSKIQVDKNADQNKFLKLGKENAFLVRESTNREVEMAVLRLNPQGVEDNKMIIQNKSFKYNGDVVEPYQANLHEKDKKLIIFDKYKPNDLYMMDMEREQIVQKWTDNSLNISAILDKPNNTDISNESFVLGYTPQTLFSLDTRVNNKITGQRLTYATPLHFNSGATNKNGDVTISSSINPEIRLYNNFYTTNSHLRSAKTLFKNIGCPVHYISVTDDGDWILATTKQYLYLQCTKHKKNNYENGFDVTLRYNARHDPIILEVDKSDWLNLCVKPEEFVKAVFDKSETSIFAIAGSYTFIWDFDDIKNGKINNYKICILDQKVKDVGINEHQDGQNLFMATERGIAIERLSKRRKRLIKRDSLK